MQAFWPMLLLGAHIIYNLDFSQPDSNPLQQVYDLGQTITFSGPLFPLLDMAIDI